MSAHDPDEINQLIGEFMDLQELWEKNSAGFDWAQLEALARKGACAYNEEAGPSFHALALDAVTHTEFHERFLTFLLRAGFDPFTLSRPGTGVNPVPVIDHADLADASQLNASSARMRAALMQIGRERFSPLVQDIQSGKSLSPDGLRVIETCAESIPRDLLEQISPELAREHHGEAQHQPINPTEGYLLPAEFIVDTSSKPYG